MFEEFTAGNFQGEKKQSKWSATKRNVQIFSCSQNEKNACIIFGRRMWNTNHVQWLIKKKTKIVLQTNLEIHEFVVNLRERIHWRWHAPCFCCIGHVSCVCAIVPLVWEWKKKRLKKNCQTTFLMLFLGKACDAFKCSKYSYKLKLDGVTIGEANAD